MSLRVLKDMFYENTIIYAARALDKYMKFRYGKKADVCVVSASEEGIAYNTTAIRGLEEIEDGGEKICSYIRSKCGQNALNTHGLTPPGKELPVLALLPTPSLFRYLGITETMAFIKAWPGTSMIGNAVVIKYVTWERKEEDDLSD